MTITSTLNQPPAAWNVWTGRYTLAPEPVIEIDLAPGQAIQWTTTHRFALP